MWQRKSRKRANILVDNTNIWGYLLNSLTEFQNREVMNKILTIIIPTYNMEKYLRKCLDSFIVSDENMERLEVLVINDGSKDSSSTIGHEYE